MTQQSEMIPIEGGGHNNLPSFEAYHEQLYDILNDEEWYNRIVEQMNQSSHRA